MKTSQWLPQLTSSLFFIFLLLFTNFSATAQIGINNTDPKAMLDVTSHDSGILIPRVELQSTNVAAPVISPEVSELVFNTQSAGSDPNRVTPGFYYWDGSKWVRLDTGDGEPAGDKWDLKGNANTTPGINFLGTTDNQELQFKTGGQTRLIMPVGNQILAAQGAPPFAPFYSFAHSPDAGLTSPNVNLLNLVTNGKLRLFIGNDVNPEIVSLMRHRFVNGTEELPALAFDQSIGAGIFRPVPNQIGFSTSAKERMRINNGGLVLNSSLSLKEGTQLNLNNGVNTNIIPQHELSPFSHYRITGPSAAFSIGGIKPLQDADGQVITLINTTNFPLTLIHNHSSSTNDIRIFCPTESDFVLQGKYSTVTLMYNKTLKKWMITDFADGNKAAAGPNIISVKGTTDISMNSENFQDMQGMSITFTPQNETVYVSFGASGYMDAGTDQFPNIPENGGVLFRLWNVNKNQSEAGVVSIATDYDSDEDNSGWITRQSVITGWSVGLNMFPVSVTPGVPTTLKIQWSRIAVANARPIHCNPQSSPNSAHRNLTIYD